MAVKLISSIQKFTGLAADTKPTGVPVGSTFLEYDTRATYITYDGTLWTSYQEDMGEKSVVTTAAVMTNGLTCFTIAGGPIELKTWLSICITDNDATASTFQVSVDPTVGAATTISGASASLGSATAGTIINLVGNALATAPVISPNGAAISQLFPILVPTGIITLVIGVGSTTGTWQHHIRYMPMARGSIVTASF
jgi:hypothetical protein